MPAGEQQEGCTPLFISFIQGHLVPGHPYPALAHTHPCPAPAYKVLPQDTQQGRYRNKPAQRQCYSCSLGIWLVCTAAGALRTTQCRLPALQAARYPGRSSISDPYP
jgi:hypothetical protein